MRILFDARPSFLRGIAFSLFCLSAANSVQAAPGDAAAGIGRADVLETQVGALEGEGTGASEDGPAPSGNSDWLGFWANAYEYDEMEAWLGRPVRVAHFKLPFGKNGFAQALDRRQKKWLEDFTSLVPHAQLTVILDIFPTRGRDPRFAEIAAGRWDDELRQVARRFIDTGHEDAILRLWHEPEVADKNNGPIGPTWCDDPAYVPAWQRVHGLFEAEAGAAFVWQYSVNGPAGARKRAADGTLWIEKCYPGKAYVDQVSVGAYHRMGTTPDVSWKRSLSKMVFVRDWAFASGHKFSMAEWGLWDSNGDAPVCRRFANGQGDEPSFIENTYDFFSAIPEERRGYLLYFNRMACTNLENLPRSRAKFKELFGG